MVMDMIMNMVMNMVRSLDTLAGQDAHVGGEGHTVLLVLDGHQDEHGNTNKVSVA